MQTLLLLHGAIGSSAQLSALAQQLERHYTVHTFDFSGHGGKPFAAEPFSIELFAGEVLQYMEQNGLAKVSIFGYSMGGYVGMYLAKLHPDKIDKLITLATKYQWDEAIATKETGMLNPEKIEQKVPAFAAALAERHAPNDWKEVMQKTSAMMLALGRDNTIKQADYAGINTPTLVLLGDRDKMVGLDETVNAYRSLPAAQMGMLPNTQHPIEQVNLDLLAFMVQQFLG